ncbi:MAG: DUF4291 domain-containing protein [Myxococcota bacterium]|nr:DUF4291 domain-containing protein [Myxococcota bacterium]
MPAHRAIRADHTRDTLVVYQAYSDAIADPALAAGRFVPPFSMTRMTWIKPSFLWLMARSNWGTKRGQERILALRLRRSGWEQALSEAVLTAFEPQVHGTRTAWEQAFSQATVHVQWDPERSLAGAKLSHRSIQVGISRHRIHDLVEDWIVDLRDLTPTVRKIRALRDAGKHKEAKRLLPPERAYTVPDGLQRRLGMDRVGRS